MTSSNTAVKQLFFLILLSLTGSEHAHAGSRHKGLLDALPPPAVQKAVKKPVPPPGSRGAPGTPGESPAPAHAASPGILFSATKASACNFVSQTDFGTRTILQVMPGKLGTLFLVARSQASNAGAQLLALDPARGYVSFPVGQDKTVLRLYANRKNGDLVATTPADGIHFYDAAKNAWTAMYAGERFHGFAWREDTQGFTLIEKDGERLLTRIDLHATQTHPHAFRTREDVRVADANGDWVLMIRRAAANRPANEGEILRVNARQQTDMVTVSAKTRALEALFTADNAHVLSLEDVDGQGAAIWVTAHKGNKRRPFTAEKNPVAALFLSPDRLSLGVTPDDWGIRDARLMHVDAQGSPTAQWPVDKRAHETLRIFPLNGNAKSPLALAVRSSPEQSDSLIAVEGTGTRVLWSQKTHTCLSTMRRTALKRPDGSDFIVDIYEPRVLSDSPKRSLVHVAAHESPHSPEFRALRTYWLQNGWTIFEPHARGSTERGTEFILAGRPPAPWQDIEQLLKFEADKYGSKTRTLKIISDLNAEKLGATSPLTYSCIALTPDADCATRDIARSLLK